MLIWILGNLVKKLCHSPGPDELCHWSHLVHSRELLVRDTLFWLQPDQVVLVVGSLRTCVSITFLFRHRINQLGTVHHPHTEQNCAYHVDDVSRDGRLIVLVVQAWHVECGGCGVGNVSTLYQEPQRC